MFPLKLDHVDKNQFHQVWSGGKDVHHAPRRGARQFFRRCAARVLQRQQQGGVGVVGFENGAEEIVLVSEMVIERTQGDPGIFGDLAHGGAVKTLQQESRCDTQ